MATLVLSSVGTALGGPVGGAIGALIGQSIDQQLLGPASRGPRLGDLKIQSSSYGTQIPRVYGSMRIAGTVIWATDLVESGEMSGAKGQPGETFSYSVSLAVALSSRELESVGRIWADGKLLRGAAGDFKVDTKFRFYAGGEDQDLDPFIASVEGLANTPAYRGLALAVFENLQLGEYGNRIPFLTFEVFADDVPAVGEILNDASGGIVASSESQQLIGYAAYGQSIKSAIQPLIDCYSVDLLDDGSQLVTPNVPTVAIADDDLGNSSDDRPAARFHREQLPAGSLPSELRIRHYDPALDYQSGEARASSADRFGSEQQYELPAVVSASDAKSLAQRMIARQWAERDTLTLRLSPRHMDLLPGSLANLDQTPSAWRIEQCTIDGFVNVVKFRPALSAAATMTADGGRIVAQQDVIAADVALALLDIPDVLQQDPSRPILMIAASSPSPGWKSRNVEIAAGSQVLQTQTAPRKTVFGTVATLLEAGNPYIINRDASFEVTLIDQDQWLTSCDDLALVGGSNLAVLGSEVLQFGTAEPLGQGRFRLGRLVRGRGGTEWAMETHAVGEPFALIERGGLTPVALPPWVLGSNIAGAARNVSGTTSVSPSMRATGESVRPLSPVAAKASIDASGNLSLAWVRRSRKGFAWIDGIDAPLGESFERYRVNIDGPGGSFEVVTGEPSLEILASQLADIGPGQVSVDICQIGDLAVSHASTITLTL